MPIDRVSSRPSGRPGLKPLAATLAASLLLLMTGCRAIATDSEASAPLSDRFANTDHFGSPIDPARFDNDPIFSLKGDADFDRERLSDEQLRWYERLWHAVESPEQYPDAADLATGDDAYDFGRLLYEHNHALLLGLRTTGDLRFLDEVDVLAEEMRASLRDGWCGGVPERHELQGYSDLEAEDGFLNFRRRLDSDPEHYCRDISDLEESLVHGHLAMLMYAYHLNRDLESPRGVDYGERSDFWLDYLRNHFEAKWRMRSGSRFPDMDFIGLKFCHSYSTFLLYHYYVGKRLQSEGDPDGLAYLDKAIEMTDAIFETPYVPGRQAGGFIPAETPLGDAVVYSFGAPTGDQGVNETHLEACPTVYARMVSTALLQLHLEGFYRWDEAVMRLLATGLAHFVADSEDVGAERPFAAGVTGSRAVSRIPPTTYRSRLPASQFALSTFPALSPWEESGRLREISRAVYLEVEDDPERPRRVFFPANMLLVETLEQGEGAGPSSEGEAGLGEGSGPER